MSSQQNRHTPPDSFEHLRTQIALRERTKELECVHALARLLGRDDLTPEETLDSAVRLLPPAWLYPEIACARIVLGNREARTEPFAESPWRLAATIRRAGREPGVVEVFYGAPRPEQSIGPFLTEERLLIETAAELLSQADDDWPNA